MRTVRVTVPASTANLGPGFDALALALGLHNTFELSEVDEGLAFDFTGEGADELPRDATNLVLKAAQVVFHEVGRAPGGLRIRIHSEIPLSSGLGSSATALLGGTVAANALVDYPLSREALLKLAIKLEGHPDNVTAAMLGGLVISSYDGDEVVYRAVPIVPLQAIVVLPDVTLSTGAARAAMPKEVTLKDAVQNVGRTALVVQALMNGDYALLSDAMRDKLHEPYRKKLIPGFEEASRAAREKGAAAVALSGAGPALVAFAEDPESQEAVAEAMGQAFQRATGKPARTWILPVDTQGIVISEMATDIVPSVRKRKQVARPESKAQNSATPVAKGPGKAQQQPDSSSDASAEEKQSDPPGRSLGLGEAAELLRKQAGADEE